MGQGRFQTAQRLDFDLANKEFSSGELARAKIMRPRSVRQNNFLHALIEAAFENQRGGPQLPTWRHLKSYLLVSIGHCDEVRTQLPRGTNREEAVRFTGSLAGALRRNYDTVWTTLDLKRSEVVMRFAKPTDFGSVDADEIREIVDGVVALICTEIVPGAEPEKLLNEARGRTANVKPKAARAVDRVHAVPQSGSPRAKLHAAHGKARR